MLFLVEPRGVIRCVPSFCPQSSGALVAVVCAPLFVAAGSKDKPVPSEEPRHRGGADTQPGGDWHAACRFSDSGDLSAALLESPHIGRFAYYYVRVTCVSGARAWSSPVWLIGG